MVDQGREVLRRVPLAEAQNLHSGRAGFSGGRQGAIARARGTNSTAAARAIMIRYGDIVNLDKGLGENGVVHPDRQMWVVTVHGDIMTIGPPRWKPALVHVYSVVIDAETGIQTDMCFGCEAVK